MHKIRFRLSDIEENNDKINKEIKIVSKVNKD